MPQAAIVRRGSFAASTGKVKGKATCARRHVEIMRERAGDDLRLLVNLLRHEMPVIALVDEKRRGQRLDAPPLDRLIMRIAEFGAMARQNGEIAVFEIGELIGERRQRQRIGAEIDFAASSPSPKPTTSGAPSPRADQEILLAVEQNGERESALEPRQARCHRIDRRKAGRHRLGEEMGDHLGIRVAFELMPLAAQLVAQLAKILDDAVMDDGDLAIGMRMRIAFGRLAMCRPARMADPGRAEKRRFGEASFEILEFAGGAPACEMRRLRGSRCRPNHSRDIRAASKPR